MQLYFRCSEIGTFYYPQIHDKDIKQGISDAEHHSMEFNKSLRKENIHFPI